MIKVGVARHSDIRCGQIQGLLAIQARCRGVGGEMGKQILEWSHELMRSLWRHLRHAVGKAQSGETPPWLITPPSLLVRPC